MPAVMVFGLLRFAVAFPQGSAPLRGGPAGQPLNAPPMRAG
jgi:hypothetical protein